MSDNEPNQLSTVLNNMVDGSVPNLSIKDTIDLVGPHQRKEVLSRFCAKIRYNGYIEVEGTDILEVARAFYQGYLNTDQANNLLYNDGSQTNYRASVSTLEDMCELLTQLNFKIINKRRNKYMYYIQAQRLAPSN